MKKKTTEEIEGYSDDCPVFIPEEILRMSPEELDASIKKQEIEIYGHPIDHTNHTGARKWRKV